jgi:hypothetical protein
VSNQKNAPSDIPATGIAIGAVLLAVVVLFAVFLPRAQGESSAPRLPDSLPGLGAIDADATWANVPASVEKALKKEGATVAKLRSTLAAMGPKAQAKVDKVSDIPSSSRLYVDPNFHTLYSVQAFRTEAGVFAPTPLDETSTISKVGDDLCISSTDSSTGTTTVECQASHNGLTVQVAASAKPATVAKVADDALSAVS